MWLLFINLVFYKEGRKLSGIYHFSSKECFTKFEICQVIAKSRGYSMDHVFPIINPQKTVVDRPHDCRMDLKKLEAAGILVECIKLEDWFQ